MANKQSSQSGHVACKYLIPLLSESQSEPEAVGGVSNAFTANKTFFNNLIIEFL